MDCFSDALESPLLSYPTFEISFIGAGKADAMIDPDTLGPEQCILFVDDTIAELIDPRLTEKYKRSQLKRVLFSRARI